MGGAAMLVAAIARRDAPAERAQPGDAATSPDLQDAARRSEMCSARDLPGVGLLGEYFVEEGCRGAPALTRIDPVVDFDGRFDWPDSRAGAPPRSVRWRGWVRAPMDGIYRFHIEAPDAWVTVARQTTTGSDPPSVQLHAGRYYPIEARVDRMAGAGVRLEWTAPHGARYVIPRALLQPPVPETRRS